MKKSYKQLAEGLKGIINSRAAKNSLSSEENDVLIQSMNAFEEASKPSEPKDLFDTFFNFPKESPIILAEYDEADKVMTIHRENGDIQKFHGSSTVWHKMPMMGRCTTAMEQKLSGIHTYIQKWGGLYPNAHIKKA